MRKPSRVMLLVRDSKFCISYSMILWLWQNKIFNQEQVSQDILPYKQNKWNHSMSLQCWLKSHAYACNGECPAKAVLCEAGLPLALAGEAAVPSACW